MINVQKDFNKKLKEKKKIKKGRLNNPTLISSSSCSSLYEIFFIIFLFQIHFTIPKHPKSFLQ